VPAGSATVRVRDTGIGIEPEMVGQVFDAFSQADRSLDRSRGGLGLGLTLVRGLAELHGGRAWATSEGAGRGTEIRMQFPLVPAPQPTAPEAGPRPTTAGRRVLVIEDNPDAAESLRVLLRLWGHETRVALSGPAGLEAYRVFRPEVVICDLGLPGGMDGHAVARAIRREPSGASVRLIAATGYGQPEDLRRSREAGFDYHLIKPIDLDHLLPLIASAEEPKNRVGSAGRVG
jgi:CheY-like chemotaxis protein